jgi:hypothetical protein
LPFHKSEGQTAPTYQGGIAGWQLEIKAEGVDFVVSRAPQPKNDNNGRQKTDRETGAPLHVTELVAMDETGAEVIKVTTAGKPRIGRA